MNKLPKLILASGSPRRSEILASVGWEFEKIVADVDESERPGESPDEYVIRLAREKAEKVAADNPGRLVLGADTTVVVDGGILGKPVDAEDARRMLRRLSGKRHDVLTGIAVVKNGKTAIAIQRTGVNFIEMNDEEIEYLVIHGNPYDKAGGYAVQAQAALFIESIAGDYWNVVGLPISLVYRLLNAEST